jgi:single-strand DNA-binding protein
MSLNKVILQGNLVEDVELRTTSSGTPVVNFRLAVGRPYAKEGEQNVDFFNVIAWKKLAEFVAKYFGKGSPILIWGNLQARQYTDKDGNKRTAVEVVALEATFCGGKKEESSPGAAPVNPPLYSATRDEFEEMSSDEELPF